MERLTKPKRKLRPLEKHPYERAEERADTKDGVAKGRWYSCIVCGLYQDNPVHRNGLVPL